MSETMKRAVYLIITEDYELARTLKEILDAKKHWTFITKYFKNLEDKEPSYVTTERSR